MISWLGLSVLHINLVRPKKDRSSKSRKLPENILTAQPCSSLAETLPTAVPPRRGMFLQSHQCHCALKHWETLDTHLKPDRSFLDQQIDAPRYPALQRDTRFVWKNLLHSPWPALFFMSGSQFSKVHFIFILHVLPSETPFVVFCCSPSAPFLLHLLVSTTCCSRLVHAVLLKSSSLSYKKNKRTREKACSFV